MQHIVGDQRHASEEPMVDTSLNTRCDTIRKLRPTATSWCKSTKWLRLLHGFYFVNVALSFIICLPTVHLST